ncbi:MAG TPA: Kiwa anti-phage protein KwaB-like domain-containing protein [Thermoanaerobaculia bacterium]|nr:Kiwa anti-phage protein KwaB-like domain-containing protein [Thermoanaerobaculia bacterium]
MFDRRRLLSPTSFSLLHEHGTFVRLHEPGLILDWQLAAVIDGQRLVFHSFNIVRRLFNMMPYFAEATDQQVRDLATHHAVHVENVDTFVQDADTWTRKKIALIERSDILNTQKPRQVAKVAAEYGLQVEIAKIGGKDKISIPPEKKEMKAVLQFLDEDYFTSSLTHTQFVTNSKRKLTVKP